MPFSRALMSAAALVLGAGGVLSLFAPDLVLSAIGGAVSPGAMLITQVLGTLALGLASLDWMWRSNRLGGIYGRPIVLANLLHFVSTALVMGKAISREPSLRLLWPLAVVYAVLAVAFFVLMRTDPGASTSPAARPSAS
jgi:hypothetical protein